MSRPGMRAMAYAWKYVTVRDDEEWFGLFPIPRAEARSVCAVVGRDVNRVSACARRTCVSLMSMAPVGLAP